MSWRDDLATENQIGALFHMLHWEAPTDELTLRFEWLKARGATKGEFSDEMGRIKELQANRQLNKENAFSGKFWEGYEK